MLESILELSGEVTVSRTQGLEEISVENMQVRSESEVRR
jgi:hypothetical protein